MLQCRRTPAGPLFLGELVGEERESEDPPGEIRLGEKEFCTCGDRRQTVVLEGGESGGERPAALGRVELGGEPGDRDRIEIEVAVRVAPGRKGQEGAPARRLQPGLVERHGGDRKPGERHEELGRPLVEPRGFELF